MSIVLKLILAYVIMALVVMWLFENVIFGIAKDKLVIPKDAAVYYENLMNQPILERFVLYLFWPKFIIPILQILF